MNLKSLRKALLLGWLGWLALAGNTPAGVTTITFADPPPGPLAPAFYSGVVFGYDPLALSPQVAATAGNQFLQVTAPLFITFATPQQRVNFSAGVLTGYSNAPITVTAYTSADPSSQPIATAGTILTSSEITAPLAVERMLSGDIVMVKVDTVAANLDNLEYESANSFGTRSLITFEGVGLYEGERLGNQFPGVSFDNTNADNAVFVTYYPDTITPTNVAETFTSLHELSNPGFILLALNPSQGAVRVRVGNPTAGSLTAYLRAYGTVIAPPFGTFRELLGAAEMTFAGPAGITNILEVDTWPATNITSVEIEYSGEQYEVIDNLEFGPNNPTPHADNTPPAISAFTVNGQTAPVVVWRPGPAVGTVTNVDVAGLAIDDTSLRSVVIYVLNATTSVITSNNITAGGTAFPFELGRTIPVTAGTNLVWAVAVDNGGNVSAPGPVVTVVAAYPATEVHSVAPLSGAMGLHIRDAYAYYPPNAFAIDIPASGQTITVTGTNLHSRVWALIGDLVLGGDYTVYPATVAPDGSSATYLLPDAVFGGAFPAGASFPLTLVDEWPGDEHFLQTNYYTVEASRPIPMPMLYGFSFPNRADGVDGNDFDDALDGDSHLPSPLCFANPLNLIFYPVYAFVLEVVSSPGSCFGMAATSQMYYNAYQGFRDRNFMGLDYPAGVYYPIGWQGGPGYGSAWRPGDCGPADPATLWAEIRANHGVQLSGQLIEHYLGQCFPDDPGARLTEVAAAPHNYIISMIDGARGHAVAPYAVVGNRIYVVDSNRPFDWEFPASPASYDATNSYIEVDTAMNTFSYAPQSMVNCSGLYLYPMSMFVESRGFPLNPLAYIEAAICGSADPLFSTPDGGSSLGWKNDGTLVHTLPGATMLPIEAGTNMNNPVLVAVSTNYGALNIQANVRTNGPYLFLASNAGRVLECHALDGAAGQTATLSLTSSNGQPYAASYKAPGDGTRMVPRLGLREGGFDAVFEIGGLTLPAGGGVQVSFTPNTNAISLQNLSSVNLHPLLVYTSTDDSVNGTSLAFGPFDLPTGATYRLTVAYSPIKPLLTIELYQPATGNFKQITILNGTDTRSRFNPGPDCNQNGTLDAIDIALGKSLDGNGDGIPDECQQPPAQPPVLTIPSFNANGQFTFQVVGQPLASYVVEASPDLRNWTPVLTNQAAADGTLTYYYGGPPKVSGGLFYRARKTQ